MAQNGFDMSVFYKEEDPIVPKDFEDLLLHYSHISEGDIVPHVRRLRDHAWSVKQYPCIGSYLFQEISIARHPEYESVLRRIRAGQTILDLGCCFGQDLRKLIFDAAVSEGEQSQLTKNFHGLDIVPEFLDMGYELFNDKHKFGGHLVVADLFAHNALAASKGSFDMIHAADFFHTFNWSEQAELLAHSMGLLRQIPNSMLFGRQLAVAEAKTVTRPIARSGEMFMHNKESFLQLLDQVRKEVGVSFVARVDTIAEQSDVAVKDGGFERLCFAILLQ